MFPIPDGVAPARKPQIIYGSSDNRNKIGVTPGAVAGAIIGGAIAKGQIKKEHDIRVLQENARAARETPVIDGSYYNQVKSVASNLNVIFTPVSAVFTVKNGKKDFTLDTVEVGEMNSDMKMAWKAKNDLYFKDVLMTKMLSEMQVAEESFAKSFIKKQLGVKDMITKDASDTSFLDEISTPNLFIIANNRGAFFDGSEVREKIASAVIADMDNEEEIKYINLCLDGDLNKYAGVITGITSSLGLTSSQESISSVKKKLENPRYTMKNIKVGFFPDRVVFSLGNQLVSTLSLLSMNEEGYNHFNDKNTKYFKNFFADNAKELMKRASISSNVTLMEKVANEEITEIVNGPSDCLLSSDTHPVTLYLYLTSKLGIEWLSYDIAVIEDILKAEFALSDIPETTINKVIAILMANQSESPYLNAYAFEKVILCLCSKPVDFLAKEKAMINIQDIVFTIDVLDRVTPRDDIYDNFSREVLNYICDALSSKDMYVYNPTNIIMSPLEPAFTELLNEMLLKAIKGKMTLSSDDPKLDELIHLKCEYIADNALAILKAIRRHMFDNPTSSEINRGDLIDVIMKKKGIKEDMLMMVKKQTIVNLAIDDVLSMYENTLQTQFVKYGIMRPEGE